MSFFGAVLGGMIGSVLGGPLGGLLGAALGYRMSGGGGRRMAGRHSQQQQQLAFATALIVLSAKMAKADGRVSPAEVAAFKKSFKQIFAGQETDMEKVAQIFNEAKRDAEGFEPYAQQIASMVPKPVLEMLLHSLLAIAMADNVLHPAEREYLRRVSGIFGFSAAEFERLIGLGSGSSSQTDPWQVLGISADADDGEIKIAYRRLAKEHHPDRLIAQGLPEEMVEKANERMAAINVAYDQICKERDLR